VVRHCGMLNDSLLAVRGDLLSGLVSKVDHAVS
jgi:hypothetical protein